MGVIAKQLVPIFFSAIFAFYPMLAFSQGCSEQLEQKILELEEIIDDIDNGLFTEDVAEILFNYRNNFSTVLEGPDISGTAGGVVISQLKRGPQAWILTGATAEFSIPTVLFAAVSGALADAVRSAGSLGAFWSEIDDNTAFYQIILDLVEKNSLGDVDDENFRNFVEQHAEVLEEVSGGWYPLSTSSGLEEYMRKHALTFLVVFGKFEELSPESFPRHRWVNEEARYGGGNRYDIGYYSILINGLARDELKQTIAALRLAQETACDQ